MATSTQHFPGTKPEHIASVTGLPIDSFETQLTKQVAACAAQEYGWASQRLLIR